MTNDLSHLGTIIEMVQQTQNKINILTLQLKALERSQYLLEKT